MRNLIITLSMVSLLTTACSELAHGGAGAAAPPATGTPAAPATGETPDPKSQPATPTAPPQNKPAPPGNGNPSAGQGGGSNGKGGTPTGGPPSQPVMVETHRLDDLDVLVNKQFALPADYAPTDLVRPNVTFSVAQDLPKHYLRKEAAQALERMFAKAKEENVELVAVSGYRSYQRQKSIFEWNAKQEGEAKANLTSARPGQSEHQTGLAMDVSCKRLNYALTEAFANTPEGRWLARNAAEFGFIIRYPKGKEQVTGYLFEPWHIRYVGVKAAKEITSRGITLEEYLMGVPASANP